MLQTQQILQQRYQLQRQLGNNPHRYTWLAQDLATQPKQQVIVKLLAFSPQMQWEEFKLFEREAQVLKHLNHPRLPKYRDYFSLDRDIGQGLCWFALVQDYIPGQSLQQLLDEGQHFTQEQVRSIATQVLEILTYLHRLNPPVLHRDIKPSNLIWGEDEQVYLVDFGAVQDPTAVEGVTFTVVGTAGYAPLEQFYGKAVPASDLYALGATLIHLLTGTAPADLPQSKLRIQFRDKVSLTPSFLSWIESLTEPDLEWRFWSAAQAIEALKTGHSLNHSKLKIRQPVNSRIRLKKSPKQLLITIPHQIVFGDFVKFGLQVILTTRSRILLLLPSLIMLSVVVFIAPLFYLAILEMLIELLGMLIFIFIILIGFLIYFMCYPWFKLLAILTKALVTFFGHQGLYFDRESVGIEQRLFIFRDKCRKICQISDIQNVQAIPSEGVVIQIGAHRYVFAQKLTVHEADWLVGEIHEWLKSI